MSVVTYAEAAVTIGGSVGVVTYAKAAVTIGVGVGAILPLRMT